MYVTLQYYEKEEDLKQKEISTFSRLHKENNRIKMSLHFLFLTCCAHPFSIRTFLFTKNALRFVVFILSLSSNVKHDNFGKHI